MTALEYLGQGIQDLLLHWAFFEVQQRKQLDREEKVY
jgi:hypothetical protein